MNRRWTLLSALSGYQAEVDGFPGELGAREERAEDGQVPATTQLTLAFLSAGRRGPITVDAQVRKQGDQVLLCDADVEQDGRTLAHAVATFAVLQR